MSGDHSHMMGRIWKRIEYAYLLYAYNVYKKMCGENIDSGEV